jgi:acyl carrier protein
METRIKNVMASVFEISAENITNDLSPDTIESWDSLKHMNLIVALEEEFKMEFSDDEIVEMMNFSLVVEIIKVKVNL